MNCQSILTIPLICLLTICCLPPALAQPQNLRAATASSYLERGNAWFAKGEYERALADFDLAIASERVVGIGRSSFTLGLEGCFIGMRVLVFCLGVFFVVLLVVWSGVGDLGISFPSSQGVT